jgi:uncharacterized protein
MNSLSFPDINVWLAVATPEHAHSAAAGLWWEQEAGIIAFSRFTQLGLLRLLTTAAAMDGKPLTVNEAWRVHDRFYDDDRVTFLSEPAQVDTKFRERTSVGSVSPKIWADAWLLATADAAQGLLITFDKALVPRGARCLI